MFVRRFALADFGLEHEAVTGDDLFAGDHSEDCLLYTSDAADERSSVDLGGRRIIKKKNSQAQSRRSRTDT